MSFDWDSMAGNLQDNAFKEKKQYSKNIDERFWVLGRDENDVGGALIRFMPDENQVPFVALEQINASKGKKQFFVREWSPKSIGLKCPFDEKFSELWKAKQEDTAKQLGRKNRYITNIKIIKDPGNPENEGKIFLYEMSQTMMDMLKGVMVSTPEMKALGEDPVAVYNPIAGNNFLIKAKRGSNGIITYGDSKFQEKITSIYADADAHHTDLAANGYALKEFLEPSSFKTYDELKDLLDKFLKEGKYAEDANGVVAPQAEPAIDTGMGTVTTVAAVTAVAVEAVVDAVAPVVEVAPDAPAPVADEDLDLLLDML